jgi:hypothetical protein
MTNITRTFIAGKMNKVVDDRLIPNGEYIDALNIRMGSAEKSDIGVVSNTLGNTKLSFLMFEGIPLSDDARCIGSKGNGSKETIYWFVHDPSFPLGATGKLDMVVSLNTTTSILTYHLITIDDGGGINTTLNFNPLYTITGIDLLDDMLFWTDDYNPPRKINITKAYPIGGIGTDPLEAEEILVIKKPPIESPPVQVLYTGNEDNFLQERLICFAYRYLYEDDEYSAISQFSAPAFIPKAFNFSVDSYLNEGMINYGNAAIISYNTGSKYVKGIDILFKEADSNIINVIEKLNKKNMGLVDNTVYTYSFANSKIFTILPDYELLRLFDSVPLLAKAQTIMGNRIMFGNYVEGYDLIDKYGNPSRLDYFTDPISEEIGVTSFSNTFDEGSYSIDGVKLITNSIISIDLTGYELKSNSSITIDLRFEHSDWSGIVPPPYPTDVTANTDLTFPFILPRDYSSVHEMVTSDEFLSVVGTVANIKPMSLACNGGTWTDFFNCNLPNNLGGLYKSDSGIDGLTQPIKITSSTSSSIIEIQLLAAVYVDDLVSPTVTKYEYYKANYANTTFQEISTPRSLHSNRGYEVAIVYMDDFLRSSTALVSADNTVSFPCSASDTKNSIRVTIPTTQIAPYWATRYKFVIKPDEHTYETIYSNIFFNDPKTNSSFFLLDGENSQKIEKGDRLIVKADTEGATTSCVYATVLDKEAQIEGFIEPVDGEGNVIVVPSGVYMKLNANDFNTVKGDNAIIDLHEKSAVADYDSWFYEGRNYPILHYPVSFLSGSTVIPIAIPQGSIIKLSYKFERKGTGGGDNACERRNYTLDKTLVASAPYLSFKAWWDGDNVQNILNTGTADIGGGECLPDNSYDITIATNPNDINTSLCTNYWRFFEDPIDGRMYLMTTGTKRCTGDILIINAKKRKSYVTAHIIIFTSSGTVIFETEPQDASPDIFFENEESFAISSDGEHMGNVQNQDFLLNQNGIVDTGFFNCYAFGNGTESYKIRDSIVGKGFNFGNRVTAVSVQDYKSTRRFADITYSGIFNNESNVNKLNEFNAGLLNYKRLENSFGLIQIMDGRETDVLVIQEDKISYVLSGKNLLSDAAAGGTITSIPEVLGTQLARIENYGISHNPESYVSWGYDKYFTDAKRGVVLQLKGGSYNSDKLTIVSEFGMRTWFRDLFHDSFDTQKLGGYDPYLGEYVLSSNNIKTPSSLDCAPCGTRLRMTISEGSPFTTCVNLGSVVGHAFIQYTLVSAENTFQIDVSYNSVITSTGEVSDSGYLNYDKNEIEVQVAYITITSQSGDVVLDLNIACVEPNEITIFQVVVTNSYEAFKYSHIQYRFQDGMYVSPIQSTLIQFAAGSTNPLVTYWLATLGFQGFGAFPTNGSTVSIISNKYGFDNFIFDPLKYKFRYLRTDTFYGETPPEVADLIAASSLATPNVTDSPNQYHATFVMPSTGDNLYLIWDLRDAVLTNLCRSTESILDVCCSCCNEPCNKWSIENTIGAALSFTYADCGGEIATGEINPYDTIMICSMVEPHINTGVGIVTFAECGCGGD